MVFVRGATGGGSITCSHIGGRGGCRCVVMVMVVIEVMPMAVFGLCGGGFGGLVVGGRAVVRAMGT